ncbi:MAG: hypothetical protein C0404_11140 [Verrucomicrobia bacterium]|nr:hypothetical protein [Verrucomicrobiota bacterium]
MQRNGLMVLNRTMTEQGRREAPMNKVEFYAEATSRNIGLLTEQEQEQLRGATVAIAGMGAVGGHYLTALARMGVGKFVIADGDTFDTVNLHRQAGAFVKTLGRSKVEVMSEMARDINPTVEMRTVSSFLNESNVDAFLDGADIVLDGIDFFQIDARRMLFRKAREKGLFVISCGPIGYGAGLMVFDPNGMSFDDYFGIRTGMTRAERIACFIVGLAPSLLKRGRGIDVSKVDIEREKGPALISAVMLCAGIVATEAMKILTGCAKPKCVPHTCYFDPFSMRFKTRYSFFGRTTWLDRLGRFVAFLKLPALRKMHEDEKARRACAA